MGGLCCIEKHNITVKLIGFNEIEIEF